MLVDDQLTELADRVVSTSRRWHSPTTDKTLSAALKPAEKYRTFAAAAGQHLTLLHSSLAELEYFGRPDDVHRYNRRAQMMRTDSLADYDRLLAHVHDFISLFGRSTNGCSIVSLNLLGLLLDVLVRVDCAILVLDKTDQLPVLPLERRINRCQEVQRDGARTRTHDSSAREVEEVPMRHLDALEDELRAVRSLFWHRWDVGHYLLDWGRVPPQLSESMCKDDGSQLCITQRALGKGAEAGTVCFFPRSRRELSL